jgi:flagellar hook-associated protein 1 FlgK
MADLLNIGLSALVTHQRALATISNNIANVNTEGYSRQRVNLSERLPEKLGNQYVGTGVMPVDVLRISDDILAAQLRSATSSFHRADSFNSLATQIDNLLADDRIGLNATLQDLMNAVQDVADQPSSIPARQVLLSEARNLATRFDVLQNRLDEIMDETQSRMSVFVTELNSIATTLADINRQISSSGEAPPALLDQRDQVLKELSELVNVNAVINGDGTASVFVGNGQALVLGSEPSRFAVQASQYDPQSSEIYIQAAGFNTRITDDLSGGKLGGVLDFRRDTLLEARSMLGRLATGIVDTFNSVHREGVDLQGQLGTDFFSIGAADVYPAVTNGGTGTLGVAIADLSATVAASYRLSYDGVGYQLLRTDTQQVVPMTGTGTGIDPFLADGLAIVVAGAPAAGDRFLIDPFSRVAGQLDVQIDSPERIAAAAPIRTSGSLANQGDGSISAGEVADITDPGLLTTTTLTFLTPATYSINGAGSFAYSTGTDIIVNGTRVQITGQPAVGDEFVIEANTGGVGDNRNALRLADVAEARVLDGGTTSLRASISRLVTSIGAQVAENESRRDAEQALLTRADENLESLRGVNLDEEAANLLRFQQAYEASTRTIAVAQILFDSLLAAVRR